MEAMPMHDAHGRPTTDRDFSDARMTWSVLRRFGLQAAFAAHAYTGYRIAATRAWLRFETSERAYSRQHRRTARAAKRLASRLGGLPVKLAQFLSARPDLLPIELVG